jgi:pyruvate/oxaloacetate carboxyltransferase
VRTLIPAIIGAAAGVPVELHSHCTTGIAPLVYLEALIASMRIIEECVHVRRDLGYPIMITAHSQFVVTQAALNVAAGERYKLVIDEVIRFAQGLYGKDSGYTWMDQNLKDRLLL